MYDRRAGSRRDVSQLVVSWRNGDSAALDEMSEVSYKELRRLAHYFLSAERSNMLARRLKD